jgi:hypothetical protein
MRLGEAHLAYYHAAPSSSSTPSSTPATPDHLSLARAAFESALKALDALPAPAPDAGTQGGSGWGSSGGGGGLTSGLEGLHMDEGGLKMGGDGEGGEGSALWEARWGLLHERAARVLYRRAALLR